MRMVPPPGAGNGFAATSVSAIEGRGRGVGSGIVDVRLGHPDSLLGTPSRERTIRPMVDFPIVSRLGTPMTTVRVPFDQIAAAALDLLNHGPDRDQSRIRVAMPTLIPRRSTAVPKSP